MQYTPRRRPASNAGGIGSRPVYPHRVAGDEPMRQQIAAMLVLAMLPFGARAGAQEEDGQAARPTIAQATKGVPVSRGLFDLYFDEAHQKLLMVVRPDQLGVDLLAVLTVARGSLGHWAVGGVIVGQEVFALRRVGPAIQVLRRDVRHRADPESAVAGAVVTSYLDEVAAVLPVVAEEQGNVLVDIGSMLLSDVFLEGTRIDPGRSAIEQVKPFPANLGFRVSWQLPSGRVEMFINLLALPPLGSYEPRLADDRVGLFEETISDYTRDDRDSPKVRLINRWKLVKADPAATISEPKDPIVWWVENSVPERYRPYVRAGILEWNKAFEKAGFRNAIEVRQQTKEDDIDPADIRYNCFRWGTRDAGFAIGPSASDPRTGQILGAEVVFDDSMIRFERIYSEALGASATPAWPGGGLGWLRLNQHRLCFLDPTAPMTLAEAPAHAPRWSAAEDMQGPMARGYLELAAAFDGLRRGEGPDAIVPDELIGQYMKLLAMHEVGHCLGLRHNFIASTMLPRAKLSDKELTGRQGLAGSVMDYSPSNIALPDQTQGDYYSTTVGPWDYHAVYYGYASFADDAARRAAAARLAEPGLDYATDEDAYLRAQDPRVDTFDLGEPIEWAKYRVELMKAGVPRILERTVREGAGWQRARRAYMMLVSGVPDAAYRAAAYLGGWYIARDHRGDPNARDPVTPVPFELQREALSFICDTLLANPSSGVDPALLKRLAPVHEWDDFDFEAQIDPDRPALVAQELCLAILLGPDRLRWLGTQPAYAAPGERPVTAEELLGALTRTAFAELPLAGEAGRAGAPDRVRRALQRSYVGRLEQMILGEGPSTPWQALWGGGAKVPADVRALARGELKTILAGIAAGAGAAGGGREVAAHYDELADGIERALDAQVMRRLF